MIYTEPFFNEFFPWMPQVTITLKVRISVGILSSSLKKFIPDKELWNNARPGIIIRLSVTSLMR